MPEVPVVIVSFVRPLDVVCQAGDPDKLCTQPATYIAVVAAVRRESDPPEPPVTATISVCDAHRGAVVQLLEDADSCTKILAAQQFADGPAAEKAQEEMH